MSRVEKPVPVAPEKTDLTEKTEALEKAEKALGLGVKIQTGLRAGGGFNPISNKEWTE